MILDGVSAPLQELEEAGSFESKAPTNEVNRKPLKFNMVVHLKLSPSKRDISFLRNHHVQVNQVKLWQCNVSSKPHFCSFGWSLMTGHLLHVVCL